jgi:predicted N-formylglutamate amidohydrolase
MGGIHSGQETLLGPEDPPAFSVYNEAGAAPVVLLCDHASNAIPAALGTLGLDDAARARHIAWDIGAAEVARHLAEILDAPALLSGYSRLVVDCNRALDDPTSMRQISDGTIVPGNRGLDDAARTMRADSCYWPYHRAVTETVERTAARGPVPAIVSVHSCTPVMKDFERPWHIGILSNVDRRMAELTIDVLARDAALCIGDNQPYSGLDPHGYSIETHALPAGRPNVLLEIRQDLIDTRHGARHWAELVGAALRLVLDHPSLAEARPPRVREAS